VSLCGTSEDGCRGSAVAHIYTLAGAIAISFVIVASLSYHAHEMMGLWASVVAAAVCLSAPLAASLATRAFASQDNVLTGLLVAMFLRMGIPLAFCLVMQIQKGPLVESGIIYSVLVFYLVVLAVETWFAMRHVEHRHSASGGD
jgi:thiol:disulfide interchange protein